MVKRRMRGMMLQLRRRRFRRLLRGHEKSAMPPVLHKQENSVDAHGHHREKHHLKFRERRPRRRLRVVRQDEAQHGERQDHHQKRVRALQIVALLVVAEAAEQQGQPQKTVQHQHDHGKHRVARERGLVRAGGHHERHHRHLQSGDRQRQQQRARRFAQPVRQDFRMAHDGDGRRQDDPADDGEQQHQQHRLVQCGGNPAVAEQRQCQREYGQGERPFAPPRFTSLNLHAESFTLFRKQRKSRRKKLPPRLSA